MREGVLASFKGVGCRVGMHVVSCALLPFRQPLSSIAFLPEPNMFAMLWSGCVQRFPKHLMVG